MLWVAASPLDEGSVWVTDGSSRSVVRVDARRGGVLDRIGVGNGPTGIAFGERSVWVANSLDGTVSRIDPENECRHGDDPPSVKAPTALPSAREAVWVSGEFSEQIARIDPCEERGRRTNRSRTVPRGSRSPRVESGSRSNRRASGIGEGAWWLEPVA